MIKKYTKKIIFLLAIFLILITKVDAQYKSEVYSVHNENIGGLPNSNNPSSESGRKNGLPTYSTSGNCESTYKKVDYYHSASSRLNVDLKDMYGNDIVGDRLELKSLGYKFQAGTYIQMRITEEHRISIGAKITIIKTKWKWKCRDFEWDSCKTIKGYTQSGAPICVPGYVEVGSYQACVCPAPDRPGGIAGFWVSTTSEDWKVFANSINIEPYNLSQSYKIEYKDSNKAGLPITDDTNYNDYLTL